MRKNIIFPVIVFLLGAAIIIFQVLIFTTFLPSSTFTNLPRDGYEKTPCPEDSITWVDAARNLYGCVPADDLAPEFFEKARAIK